MSAALYFGDGAPGFSNANFLLHANEATWEQTFAPRSIAKVLINFVLSKHPQRVAETLFEKLSRYQTVGGYLRIADADFAHASPDYIAHEEASNPQWRISLLGLSEMLFGFGFAVHPVEYHDRHKHLHVRPRDPAYGFISRSRLSDPRARDEKLQFSCLIVDAVLDAPEPGARTMSGEDVAEVFRGTLDRDPDCEAATRYFISRFETTDALAAYLLSGNEYRRQVLNPPGIYTLTPADYELLYQHFEVEARPEKEGFFVGVLGDHIDVRFNTMKPGIQWQIPPDPEHWASLHAARTAKDRFVAVELGSGWGPWLVKSALAARRMGISDIRLAAVEPDEEHFRWLHEHLIRHGFEPSQQCLFQGTIGARDGTAYFPVLKQPAVDWGARAVAPERYAAMKAETAEPVDRLGQPYEEVREYSIRTVLAAFEVVDFLHLDVQGHELLAIVGSLDAVNDKVRLMFVGTHSPAIDAGLIKTMSEAGWTPIHIKPRHYSRNAAGGFLCGQDGEQLWRNDRFFLSRSVAGHRPTG